MSITRLKFAPITVCLAFGLAACGDESNSSTTDDTSTTAADTTVASETSSTDAADTSVSSETSATDASDTTSDDSGGDDDDVMLADSPLGRILVDGDGFTLYLFTSDPPDTATCTGGCAVAWPAMPADDDIDVGDGLDDDQFTIVNGPTGPQLSFNGHPLYYFSGDLVPGNTNGQGVGGVWFVLDADGNAIS